MSAAAKKEMAQRKARKERDEKRTNILNDRALKAAAEKALLVADLARWTGLATTIVREVASNTAYEITSIADTEIKVPIFAPLGWGHEDFTTSADVAAAKSKSKRLRERLATQHTTAMEEMDHADRRIHEKEQAFTAKKARKEKKASDEDDEEEDEDEEEEEKPAKPVKKVNKK